MKFLVCSFLPRLVTQLILMRGTPLVVCCGPIPLLLFFWKVVYADYSASRFLF